MHTSNTSSVRLSLLLSVTAVVSLLCVPFVLKAEDGESKLATPITSLPFTINTSGVYSINSELSPATMTSGSAIIIDADNVTLELNDHSISNSNAANTAEGISALNHKNVTVRNGSVRGFWVGVDLQSNATDGSLSNGNVVENMAVGGSTWFGIRVFGNGNLVRHCQVTNSGGSATGSDGNGYGIIAQWGAGNRVIDNEVTGVTAADAAHSGYGIYLLGSAGTVVVENRINQTIYGVYYDGSSSGKYRDNLIGVGVRYPFTGGTDVTGNMVGDSNNNGIPDSWEWQYFGNLNHVDPTEDYDRDGLSSIQEYQQGTNPVDYYNGITPALQSVSGDNQRGIKGTVLPLPLVTLVNKSGSTIPAPNAPVAYQVSSGGVLISASNAGPWTSVCTVRSSATGYANVYCKLSSNPLDSIQSKIQATAGNSTPVTFTVSYISSQRIAAGTHHTLALDPDGGVWAWGDNSHNALGGNQNVGYGPVARVLGPNGVGFLDDVQAVAASGTHSIALKANGTVFAWGYNADGALGNGSTSYNCPFPVPMVVQSGQSTSPLSGIVAIAAGNGFSLMLDTNGNVWSCGSNSAGKLGNGTTNSQYTAVRVVGQGGMGTVLDHVSAIAAGNDFSVALTDGGMMWAWGYNNCGQLGNITGNLTNPVPVPVKGEGGNGYLSGITAISVGSGGDHVLALTNTLTVWAWGYNKYGQCGNDSETYYVYYPSQVVGVGVPVANINNPPPTTLGKLEGVVAIAAGDLHSVAILSGGSVCSWGYGQQGQLGGSNPTLNSYYNCDYPELVAAPNGGGQLHDIVSISAGGYRSFATASYKGVSLYFGWGENDHAETNGYILGGTSQAIGSYYQYPTPVFQVVDSDHDGLLDWREYMYGTNPLNGDSNGDGILDGVAVQAGLNPLAPLPTLPPVDPNDHTPPQITITFPTTGITQL